MRCDVVYLMYMLIIYFICCSTFFYLFIHLFLLQPHKAQMLECIGGLFMNSLGTDVIVQVVTGEPLEAQMLLCRGIYFDTGIIVQIYCW